jgi:putative flippase GtrA
MPRDSHVPKAIPLNDPQGLRRGGSVTLLSGDGRSPLSGTFGQFARYGLSGVVNTALSSGLLLLMAGWVQIELAYTIVYALGVTFATIMATRFVFRTQTTTRTVGRFVAWYVCVYLVGLSIVHLATHGWHWSHLFAVAAVVLVTAPLNFLGGRRALEVPSARRPAWSPRRVRQQAWQQGTRDKPVDDGSPERDERRPRADGVVTQWIGQRHPQRQLQILADQPRVQRAGDR